MTNQTQTDRLAEVANAIVQDVCELPDYTSPDDQPDLLQCTVDELSLIVSRNVQSLSTDLANAEARVKELEGVAGSALTFIDMAPMESGICCCGDPIKGHGYHSGHSPVDDLSYHASQIADELRAAINPGKESA